MVWLCIAMCLLENGTKEAWSGTSSRVASTAGCLHETASTAGCLHETASRLVQKLCRYCSSIRVVHDLAQMVSVVILYVTVLQSWHGCRGPELSSGLGSTVDATCDCGAVHSLPNATCSNEMMLLSAISN